MTQRKQFLSFVFSFFVFTIDIERLKEIGMALVGFQVLEGIEAGRVFRKLQTPVTIGREDENDIQLNDERISRFHSKVQEDSGRIILTDLESTNGTRVNGRPIKMRVLKKGDQISVGRCLLVVMASSELSAPPREDESKPPIETGGTLSANKSSDDITIPVSYPGGPPPLPTGLSAVQAAELTDVLNYVRTTMLESIEQMEDEEDTKESDPVKLSRQYWHRLQSLPGKISTYLNEIADPPE